MGRASDWNAVSATFRTSDDNSISFQVVMDKDRAGPRVKILNWGKANFNSKGWLE